MMVWISKRIIALFLIGAILGACWIPEDFSARVDIEPDGGYTYSYDGVLAFGLALAEAAGEPLTPKAEATLLELAADLQEEPGFETVSYIGNARYQVRFREHGSPGEPSYFLSENVDILSIEPQSDGTIEITGLHLSEKDLQKMRAIGARVAGRLVVSVPRGMEVVSHNAHATPELFGLWGNYEWRIESADFVPQIRIAPST